MLDPDPPEAEGKTDGVADAVHIAAAQAPAQAVIASNKAGFIQRPWTTAIAPP
ncbi:MAG TPA: hypothetical protein VGG46_14280 [Terriglobales bacterium]|jgi:hypothetical protein